MRAYQCKYKVTKTAATPSPIIRPSKPWVKLVPAALEAITTENGLIVEKVVPTELARKIAPTQTMES